MQSEQQFEQLIMQYEQLKNGSLDISRMIDNEDFDEAISLIKRREEIFISCKCIRKYLELTPVQQKQLANILDELKELEIRNIQKLERGKAKVQLELKKTQQTQKFQTAYNIDQEDGGSIVNIQE